METYVPFDPESKGGLEATAKIVKAGLQVRDLVRCLAEENAVKGYR